MLVISRTPIVRAPLLVLASGLVLAGGSALAFADVFVDQNATGANDGTTWMNAHNFLQDGLDDADPGETVFVAKGTYYPDECKMCGSGGTGDQTAAFNVPLEVVLKGGYAGSNAFNPFTRNFVLYETILSGDIDQNDANSPAQNPGDICGLNSFHVVTIIRNVGDDMIDDDTVIDGFTITAGNANGGILFPTRRVGGGAFVADLPVCDIPFSQGPKFQNCIFVGNRSEDVGGALACVDVGVEVRDCLILNNETLGGIFSLPGGGVLQITGGGGIAGIAPFVLVNSRIVGNKCCGAGGGGGVSVRDAAHPDTKNVLVSCLFAGNEARQDPVDRGGYGGGAYLQTGEVTNCVFSANVAYFGGPGAVFAGGGLRADDTVAVYLSSFYKNDAPNGNGGGVAFVSSLSTITNSIAWANTDQTGPTGDWRQQIYGPQNGPCPTWSNVQDWDCNVCVDCATFHNICADPYFVDPPGIDGNLGTGDDNLHLRLDSPSIDKGSDDFPMHVPRDSGDVDDDGNTAMELPWDLAKFPRKFDAGVNTVSIIDQGAYEEQCLACPWDLDGDGTVDTVDVLILQANLGALCHHANFLEPDTVGREDRAAMVAHLGDCPHGCTAASSSGPSPELEAATQLMGFAGSDAYGEWLRNEATDRQAEVSAIILSALIQD